MKNIDIRMLVDEYNIKYKDIAEKLDISAEWLSRLLRDQLSTENKERIMWAIDSLVLERKETEEGKKEIGCEFCRAYQSWKRAEYITNRYAEIEEKNNQELNCAIVVRTWTKSKGKRNASRITDYRYRGIGYKLNFCPQCGTDLRWVERM